MRIGLVIDDSLDRPDGVQQYVLTIGSWLTEHGHEVHYICTQTVRQDIDNLHSLSTALPIRYNRNNLTLSLPLKRRAIRKLFEEYSFDVLHVQLPHNPWMSGRLIAAAPKNTKIVGTFHVAPFGQVEALALKSLRFVYRSSRRKLSQLYAVSTAAQPYAEKAYCQTAQVAPNPIDFEKFAPKKKKSKKRTKQIVDIRFIGRLVPRKGCESLIRALSSISQQNKIDNFRLTIGGKGPQLERLKLLTKELHLDEYVEFAGFIPEEDKARFLQAADLVAFPSSGGESFGIVLLEAMASGACVLAGNNAGYRQVLVPEEALFDPSNAAELRDKLARFIKDAKKRQKVAELQSAHVKKYDISKVGQQILTGYEQLGR